MDGDDAIHFIITLIKAISAIGTGIRHIFREIQAPKVGRKW